MSEPSAGITFKVMQEMMPEYNIPPDLIEDVVAALPPPGGMTPAARAERLNRVIEDIASRVPMNAAQASLAGQIVIVTALANDLSVRAGAPGLDDLARCRLSRTADALHNTASRLERTLERRQLRIMPFRDVRPVEKIDMVVLDGVWCRRGVAEAPAPVVTEDAAVAPRVRPVVRGARPAKTKLKSSGPQPTAREGVTIEHGDGWSMEVWSPGAGAAAMRKAAAAKYRAGGKAADTPAGEIP